MSKPAVGFSVPYNREDPPQSPEHTACRQESLPPHRQVLLPPTGRQQCALLGLLLLSLLCCSSSIHTFTHLEANTAFLVGLSGLSTRLC